MSQSVPPSPSRRPGADSAGETSTEQWIHQGEVLVVVMLLLAGAGIAVTTFSPQRGFHYWAAMMPLFGGVSAYLAWSHARARHENTGTVLRQQLLHWLGALGALQLVFLLKTSGQVEFAALGLGALIVLALSTFLAGVYVDWRLCVVGVLLGGIALVGSFMQQFLWAALIPGVAVLGVGIVAWRRRAARTGTGSGAWGA